MQYIILIGDEKLNLDIVKSIEHYGSVNKYNVDENRYCVDYGTDHIFYDFEGNSFVDYEKSDLEKIPFENPNFIIMVYTSEKRMRNVLQQENFL